MAIIGDPEYVWVSVEQDSYEVHVFKNKEDLINTVERNLYYKGFIRQETEDGITWDNANIFGIKRVVN